MIEIKEVPIEILRENEYNPKKLSQKEESDLIKSVKEFGVVDPLIVNENPDRKNIIIGGHQRLKILKKLGIKVVPVIYVNLPLEKEIELCLRLSKNTGSWDYITLMQAFEKEFLQTLGWTFEELTKIEEYALDKTDLDLMETYKKALTLDTLIPDELKEDPNWEAKVELTEDDKKGLVQSDYLVFFPSTNKYDIPDLLPDKIYDGDLSELSTFYYVNPEEMVKPQLVLYRDKHLIKQTENKILGFFLYDYEFQAIWDEAYHKVKELSKRKWLAIMSPDFSLAEIDPLALKIYTTYQTRYMDRYFQEFGFDVIPLVNIAPLTKRAYDFCFCGIPKDCPTIGFSLMASGFNEQAKDKEKRLDIITCFNMVKEVINPQQVVCYGAFTMYEELKQIYDNVIMVSTQGDLSRIRFKKRRKKFIKEKFTT